MDNKLNPLLKPPLSYYGGKQSILRDILPMVPQHEVYTESFFGGGSLFFAKAPAKNETINDRLDIVVNFYRQVKKNYRPLKKRIEQTLLSRYDKLEAQRVINEWKSGKKNKVDCAWAVWFLFNFSYSCKLDGGLKYSNATGTCVPEQLINKKNRSTEHLLKRLERTTIENRDALLILKTRDVPDAFHEIDPPYIYCDQGHYKGYNENDFIDLLDWCESAKGKFMLHNYNNDILEDYINRNGWYKKEVVHRIPRKRKSGNEKREVIVYNYEVVPNLFSQNV